MRVRVCPQNQPATAAGQAQYGVSTLGDQALVQRGFTTPGWWYWLSIGVLIGFIIIFNLLIIFAHTYLGRACSTLSGGWDWSSVSVCVSRVEG